MTTPATIITAHTVCSGWTAVKTFGWRVERIENTRAAVREWLGY